jgi:hypothetical protein
MTPGTVWRGAGVRVRAWRSSFSSGGAPTDRRFERAPTLEEIIEVRRSASLGQRLLCGDLFVESWDRLVGDAIEMEYPKPCG